MLVSLLVAASAILGLFMGMVYVYGFKYLMARPATGFPWGIVLPGLVGIVFFILPAVILPAPIPERPLLLFHVYMIGFFLPVLWALGRVGFNRMQRRGKQEGNQGQ